MRPVSLTLIILFIGHAGWLNAQQDPLFTQYMFNRLAYNPAAAGADSNSISLTGEYLNERINFKSPHDPSVPISGFGSFEASLNLKKSHNYIGLGLGLGYNNREPFSCTQSYLLSIAYHIITSNGGNLSIGVNSGMANIKTGPFAIDWFYQPAFSGYAFDAGTGVFYSTPKWYAGISALHIPGSLFQSVSGFDNTYRTSMRRSYYATAGYNEYIKNDPNLQLKPSFMVTSDGQRTAGIVSCLFQWKQKFWGGLSFTDDNVSLCTIVLGTNCIRWKTGDITIGCNYDLFNEVPTPFGRKIDILIKARINEKHA